MKFKSANPRSTCVGNFNLDLKLQLAHQRLALDGSIKQVKLFLMSILELKQAASQLTKRGREELHAYLISLSHNTPEWKRATARRIRMMQAGKRVSADALEARISRG
ncbi:MAG: hypothetical protein NTX39_11835 [Opitutae bacterium]|nr:hypothetical protein [Opitutae bacterium]